MMNHLFRRLFAITLLFMSFVLGVTGTQAHEGGEGVVYTSTNAASGNAIAIFERAADGSLSPAGQVATGGLGTGRGLGNQAAVVLSDNGRWLFTVNAGSNTISMFRARGSELELLGTIASGGELPISLTVHHRWLYVLNAGGDGNISGFVIGAHGMLEPLANSTRPLSGTNVGPAQIQFSPNGRLLVVTEKATNQITSYTVDRHGYAGDAHAQASVGQTPFGFSFDKRGHLIVSEAAGGAPNQGAVSSYDLDKNGNLSVISGTVADNQTAACWIVITNNGRFTYTTNAGSNTVSGYAIAKDGSLTLLGDGVTGHTGSKPIDAALSKNSNFLYTLNAGDGTISAFRVGYDGSLTAVSGASGLPAGANGLAAR